MSDRVKALTVVLEKDIREDDIQPLLAAIPLLRGVLCVEQHVADIDDFVANSRVRSELRKKLFEVLFPHPNKE